MTAPCLVCEIACALGYELGVVLDEAEQCGPARVLPLQAHEVQTGNLRHSALVPDVSVLGDGQIDPREVRAIPGRPDDGVHLQLTSVLEADGSPGGAGRAAVQHDPRALGRLRTRSDQCFRGPHPTAHPRLARL